MPPRCTLDLAEVGMQGTLLPHRLAAIWFADVVGYSARAAEDERGALQLIEIFADALAQHRPAL